MLPVRFGLQGLGEVAGHRTPRGGDDRSRTPPEFPAALLARHSQVSTVSRAGGCGRDIAHKARSLPLSSVPCGSTKTAIAPYGDGLNASTMIFYRVSSIDHLSYVKSNIAKFSARRIDRVNWVRYPWATQVGLDAPWFAALRNCGEPTDTGLRQSKCSNLQLRFCCWSWVACRLFSLAHACPWLRGLAHL